MFHHGWLKPGEILLLPKVGLQVEELNGFIFIVFEELVVSQADGPSRALIAVVAVVREVPEEGPTIMGLPEQGWHEALPIHMLMGKQFTKSIYYANSLSIT